MTKITSGNYKSSEEDGIAQISCITTSNPGEQIVSQDLKIMMVASQNLVLLTYLKYCSTEVNGASDRYNF